MKKFYDIDNQATIKKKAYVFLCEIAKCQKHNKDFMYRVFLALEVIQFYWYSIAPKFAHNTSARQWLETTLYTIQIDKALDTNSSRTLLSLLYLSFGWKMGCFLLAFFVGSKMAKSNAIKSRGRTFFFNFLHYCTGLMTFWLALPMFHIYLAVIICQDDNKVHGDLVCYQGTYFVHLIVAILGIISLFLLTISTIVFFSDLNPFSNTPHASPQGRTEIYRLYLKFILALFAVLVHSTKSLSIVVYVYGVIWLGMLFYRYRQVPDVNKRSYFFKVGLEVLVLWLIIYELVRLGIDEESKDASISVIFFLCCPIIIYGVNHIIKQRHSQFKIMHIKDFTKDTDVEIYIHVVMELIKRRKHPKQWMELEGLVNYHVRQCTIATCQCLQLSKNEDLSPEEDEKLWFRWVHNLIEHGLEKFPKSAKLHLLSAFVQKEKLKNTFKALHQIEITETLNRIAEEDFNCFFYKILMEEEIIESDEKEKETKGTEFSRIMAFNEGFTEFERLLSEAINFYIDFWSELLEASPHITRLYSYGSQVVDSTDKIMEKYANLIAINPSHVRLHQAYGDFTKIVLPDSNESSKAFEKLDHETTTLMTKHQIDTYAMRYIEEDQDRFIVISGNHKNMGIITDIGTNIPKMFGYSKAEILNRNVNVLMPKVFAEVHDQLLGAYMLNTSEKSHDPHKSKIIFPADKTGYLVPCHAVIYILPTLNEGIRLAGFLRELDDLRDEFGEGLIGEAKTPCYLVINTDTQLIQGVSRSCWDSFGISCNFVEGNEGAGDVGVTDLFGEFGGLDMIKLKSEEGIETMLDTSKLSQYHFISENALREEEEEGQGENTEREEQESSRDRFTRFRQSRVLLKMVLEADYFGNRVQVLKFTEIVQEGETQRVKSPKILKRQEMFPQNANHHEEASPKDQRSADSEEDIDGIGEGSVGTVNEELKVLKEIRILFSNKQSSRAMRVLLIVFALFFLLLIGLAAFQLSMIKKQIQDFSDLINYTMVAQNRYRSIADLTSVVRQYQYITYTRSYLTPAYLQIYTDQARNKIKKVSTSLSNYQFSLIQAELALDGTSFVSADTKTFTFELFVDTGRILQEKLYLDGYFQYMTSVDQVYNSSLDSLVSPQSTTDPGLKSFRYAIRNGFGPLREGAELMLENFDNYHDERIDYYGDTFKIILIITEITIAVAAVISIPFGFAVFHTQDKIIALFGYIPVSQIEQMIENGERYKEEYLKTFIDPALIYEGEEESSLGHSRNVINTRFASQEHGARSPDESQVPSNMDESEDPDTVNIDENIRSPTIQLSPLTLGTQMPTLGYRQTTIDAPSPRDPGMMTSARLLSTQNQQQFSERNLISSQRFNRNEEESSSRNLQQEDVRRRSIFDKEKIVAAQESIKVHNEEIENDRIPKKIRSEKGNKRLVVFAISAGTVFWVVIFIITYVFFELWFLDQTKKIYLHATRNMLRTSHFLYTLGFINEEITNPNTTAVYDYPGETKIVNQRIRYRDLTNEVNSHVMDADNLELPGPFKDYINLYVDVTTGSVCDYYSTVASEIATCEQFGGGIMKNGLRMIILSSLNLGDTIMKDYEEKISQIDTTDSAQVNATIVSVVTSSDYIELATTWMYLDPTMAAMRTGFAEAKDKFFDHCRTIGVMEFVGYLILIFLMYGLMWYQSAIGIGNRIIKSKRMLNMMPMDLVLNNELLKEKVLSQDIQRVLT